MMSPPAKPDPMGWDRLVCRLAITYGADARTVRDSEEYADGWVGLLAARDRFDAGRGVAFTTLAFKCIRSAILNGRDRRHGGPGSPKRRARVVSLSALEPLPGGEGPEPAVDRDDERRAVAGRVASILAGLGEQERRIVEALHLRGRTLTEVGRSEPRPISRTRVGQIRDEAFARVRHGPCPAPSHG